MCSETPLTSFSSIPLSQLRTPYSLGHNNIEIRPINNATMIRKSHTFLTLDQKLEMIKLNEEGMLKPENG